MMLTRKTGKARTWIVPSSAVVTLVLGYWAPCRGEERRGSCDGQDEIVAIYDCQTGLVLWSRRPPGQPLPMVRPHQEFCRLVIGEPHPTQSIEQCS